jgi:hypothetical protein
MRDQWAKGEPWSLSYNSPDRYVVNFMTGRWGLKKEIAKDIVNTWLANKLIASEVYDAHNNLKGIRVL